MQRIVCNGAHVGQAASGWAQRGPADADTVGGYRDQKLNLLLSGDNKATGRVHLLLPYVAAKKNMHMRSTACTEPTLAELSLGMRAATEQTVNCGATVAAPALRVRAAGPDLDWLGPWPTGAAGSARHASVPAASVRTRRKCQRQGEDEAQSEGILFLRPFKHEKRCFFGDQNVSCTPCGSFANVEPGTTSLSRCQCQYCTAVPPLSYRVFMKFRLVPYEAGEVGGGCGPAVAPVHYRRRTAYFVRLVLIGASPHGRCRGERAHVLCGPTRPCPCATRRTSRPGVFDCQSFGGWHKPRPISTSQHFGASKQGRAVWPGSARPGKKTLAATPENSHRPPQPGPAWSEAGPRPGMPALPLLDDTRRPSQPRRGRGNPAGVRINRRFLLGSRPVRQLHGKAGLWPLVGL